MEELQHAHSVLHQITEALGIQQCTATQVLGICIEFWFGIGVATGAIKLKEKYSE